MSTQAAPPPSPLAVLVANRQQVAIGLAVAGVVLAALAVWWGVWGFARSAAPAADTTAEGKLLEEPAKTDEAKADEGKPRKSPDYKVACVWAAAVAALCLLCAAYVFTQPADPSAPMAGARKEVLVFGGVVGLLTALAGAFLGYRWHPSLTRWVTGGDRSEAQWVLYAACIFLAGLILMFASLQLARTEQRTNAPLRRVLYGFNSVFVGLLVLLVLVALNVVSFLKVPGTLVTNDTAFTSLSDESKRFLQSLDRPVHVYLVMPENYQVALGGRVPYDSLYADCRGLLSQCEDESGNFHAAYLSPAFDRERITALMGRLKVKEEDRKFGLFATAGEGEESYAFLPAEDLIEIERGMPVFQGESRLMTELMYLTDTRAKEKVYFTAGHGELKIDSLGGDEPSAANVVRFLRDRKMTVEALAIKDTDAGAKVPDDAGVVVVAGPRTTIPADSALLAALREYLQRPNKPGKLLAFLPAFQGTDRSVAPTGLEGLLRDFGVDLAANKRLVTIPDSLPARDNNGRTVFAPPQFIQATTFRIQIEPLARAFGRVQLPLEDARPVRPGAPGGPFRASPLLGTVVLTWTEESFATRPQDTLERLVRAAKEKDPSVEAEKQVSERGVPVAVAVTEPPAPGGKGAPRPRAIVFGSDTLIQDHSPIQIGGEEYRQQLASDCIDWLRERDTAVGIKPRNLGTFVLEKPIDWPSQVALLALVAVGVASLGIGVWLSRRR